MRNTACMGLPSMARPSDGKNRPMADDLVRRRVVVRGRVQGVFFRDSMRERAETAGVAGWVRNCADGSLEAVLEGPEDAVKELARFASSGPPRASVDDVQLGEEEPEGLRGFEIR